MNQTLDDPNTRNLAMDFHLTGRFLKGLKSEYFMNTTQAGKLMVTGEDGKSLTLIHSHNSADVLYSARAYMWAKITELIDRNNELGTN